MNSELNSTEYYIGLDCGTSSVGFAVTDVDYSILKFNGKAMWGSHLFDEAKTAQERRGARCARRRLQRRKQRTALLQEIFAEEIYKVDPTFFIRLNDSQYLEEDKRIPGRNIIFNDKDFKDKDYFKKYPTAYHLRKSLMEEKVADPRLLYLGLNHILKHRGHFLFPGDNLKAVNDISPVLDSIENAYSDIFGEQLSFYSHEDIEKALLNKSNISKKEGLESGISLHDTKKKALLVKAVLGYNIKPHQLFDNEEYKDCPAIEFKKLSFEEKDLPEIEETVSDDEYKLILNLKSLFDWGLLARIMQGHKSISEAKSALFEKNKKDLKILKEVIRTYAESEYDDFFHSMDKGKFSSYIGKSHDKRKGKEGRCRKSSVDDFYKTVKKILNNAPKEDAGVKHILNAIEEDSFLPLLSSYRNGVIPYQMNKAELESILDKASKYFDFLSRKDEDGLSPRDKILSILTYRIPYFVGPLGRNADSDAHGWLVRKEKIGRILPWNIEQKVDYEESAEKFIKRMTNKCTYCKTEDVLPKNSLSYSKFMVLNELNNVRLNGERLSVERKQSIFNGLFKKRKKVTKKQVVDFAVKEGWYGKDDLSVDDITGIDEDFKASLGSYADFRSWIEQGKLKADDVDEIIKWITIFSEGGEILKKRIRKFYGDVLDDNDINAIAKLKYAGWGRFSHKFLYGIQGMHKETGELMSIMRMLWHTQHNLMELLGNDYEFIEQVDKPQILGKLDYSIVDDLHVSPAVKRQIWQTLRIVDELRRIMKHDPRKVFMEVTRSEQEKKRTVSRKKDLIGKLKEAEKGGLGFGIEVQELISSLEGKDESAVSRQDKLYLYYSQCGKCMYTNEPIDLDDLYNTDLYDVDHIYPYSKTDDDSLKNRVLVLKKANSRKSDSYPIDDSIRHKMAPFWKMLSDKGFIPKEKYERLVRTSPLSADEMKGFINRQLVETSQNVKATAAILKSFFGEGTKIVYSKARKVSDFRDQFDLVKCRSLNELHHAKDAYLNIVVGNVLDTKYTSEFYKHADGRGYGNVARPFDFDVKGAWLRGSGGTIAKVRDTLNKNNILFTRQPVARTGALFDLQIVPKGSKKGALPVKPSEPRLKEKLQGLDDPTGAYDEWTSKYGGYNSMSTSYFALVRHADKKRSYASFVPIAMIDAKRLSEPEQLLAYCRNVLRLENPVVVNPRLLMNTQLEIDGYRFSITGKSNGGKVITLNSSIPLFLSQESQQTLKKIERFFNKKRKFPDIKIDSKHDGMTMDNTLSLYKELLDKLSCNIYLKRPSNQSDILKDSRNMFENFDLADRCNIIREVVNYFAMNEGKADLTLINGTKACGVLTKGARIDLGKTDLCIIYQSITGLFETREQIKP